MRKVETVVLYDSDFAAFSRPIDLSWLQYLAQIQLEKCIYVVGSGVTASEYAFILLRAGIRHDLVDVEELDNILLVKQNIFVLVASPGARKKIEAMLIAHGFQKDIDYLNHLHALRNRAVIDFRGWTYFDAGFLALVLSRLIKMPTVGGVDFLIDEPLLVDKIESVLSGAVYGIHTKVTYYPRNLESWDFSGIKKLQSLEINLLDFPIPTVYEFVASTEARIVLSRSEKIYLMLAREMVMDDLQMQRVYFENKYPWYFDRELTGAAVEVDSASYADHQRCLSRRMFPIFAGDFSLKLCSLYDELAKTSISFDQCFSSEYVAARNALCVRCAQKGLHRLS